MKRQTVDFTPREIEAMALLAEGRSATEIAEAVGRSAETIRSRTERARHKIGAPTIACLLDYAYRKGVLPLPEPEQQGFKTSPAELAALRLAAQGRSNTQIATELLTSRQNVVADLRKLRDRFGARNLPHMVSRAWALRLLQEPETTTASAQKEKDQ